MSTLSVTYNLSDGQTSSAALWNTNYADIVNYVNARNSGSSSWDALGVTGAATLASTLAVTGATTLTGGVVNLLGYRRPTMTFISVTQVDIEANTGTLNQTSIMFPDGTFRSVAEDTTSTNKYRRFDITATANFTSGTEDSGLRSGLSEAASTWYAIYAVKSQINTSNFVLSGDTTMPFQLNFSTLNSRYGTNSWVYIGMIRNGDNVSATSDIVGFVMSCNETIFLNIAATNVIGNSEGVRIATTAGATTLTYTTTTGTGATDIPDHFRIVTWNAAAAAVATFVRVRNSADTKTIALYTGTNGNGYRVKAYSGDGIILSNGAATSIAYDIILVGFTDHILGVGTNPFL